MPATTTKQPKQMMILHVVDIPFSSSAGASSSSRGLLGDLDLSDRGDFGGAFTMFVIFVVVVDV